MGVMTQMRDRAAGILIILIVLFVASMTVGGLVGGADIMDILSGNNPDALGVVDGEEISLRRFNDAFRNQLDNYRAQTGTDVTDSQVDFIRNQTWESLVQSILLEKTMIEKGIGVSNEEIVYHLFNDPPDIIRSNPTFLNDQKEFDMAKYKSVLSDPNFGAQWAPIEDYLRQTIPFEKFQQRLQAIARITEDEIKREYLKRNQNVTVSYIFIEPSRFNAEEFEPEQSRMEAYYDENIDEFKEEEKRRIKHVFFATQATSEDSAETRDKAEELIMRLKDGEDFVELAELHSEDAGTKVNGGDLGFFGKGAMVKEFEDAVFDAQLEEIIGPVNTQHGIHIIKLTDRKIENGNEQVKASHILLRFSASEKTKSQAKDNADYFAREAEDTSFDGAAEASGYTASNSTPFPKGSGFVPGLGLNKKSSNFIFSNEVGTIGDLEETAQGYIVYQVSAEIPAHTKALEAVTPTIKNKLVAEQRMDKCRELAERIVAGIRSGSSFEAAATEDSLQIKETSPFNRSGFVSGIGREPKFIGAAFALQDSNQVSPPVSATRGYYVLKLLSKDEFNPNDYASKKANLAKQLLKTKQNQAFSLWYANAKAKAEIEDYRDSRLF